MPGLFGSSAPGQVYDPSALSPMDKMAVFGAMLKDIGNGGQSDNIMQARQMLLGQQLARSQMGLIGAALGGDNATPAQPEQITVPGAPTMTADAAPTQPAGYGGARPGLIGGGAPSRQQKALEALALLKGDAKGAFEIMHPNVQIGPDGTPHDANAAASLQMRFAHPDNINGTVVNLNDPNNINRVIPEAPVKGAMPVYDNLGHVIDWRLPVGARSAIAGSAAATKAGEAPFDLVAVPRGDGSTVMMPRSEAVRLLSGVPTAPSSAPAVASAPNAAPGVIPADGAALGVTQSPAAATLAQKRSETQGTREADMQGARAAMTQVDDQTNMIRQNLHDMLGETQDPTTGQWVKTKPSMITGMSSGSSTPFIEHVPFVGQPAQDLGAKIETVRNGTSFNSLQAIKNALQAAGNGSGASIRMTDQTARMLGEINGSLDQTQSPQQFEDTVRRHLAQLDALDKARHDLFESQYKDIEQPTPGSTAPKPPAYAPKAAAPSRDALIAEARRRGLIH